MFTQVLPFRLAKIFYELELVSFSSEYSWTKDEKLKVGPISKSDKDCYARKSYPAYTILELIQILNTVAKTRGTGVNFTITPETENCTEEIGGLILGLIGYTPESIEGGHIPLKELIPYFTNYKREEHIDVEGKNIFLRGNNTDVSEGVAYLVDVAKKMVYSKEHDLYRGVHVELGLRIQYLPNFTPIKNDSIQMLIIASADPKQKKENGYTKITFTKEWVKVHTTTHSFAELCSEIIKENGEPK